MSNVEATRQRYFEAKKAVADGMTKKAKLETRFSELQTEFEQSKIDAAEGKKERQGVVESIALGDITAAEGKKAIDKLGRADLEHSALSEQIAVVKTAIEETGALFSELQKQLNEASSCFYSAIAEELTEQIKSKMPVRDLRMLAVCRIRSGRHWGVDGWANMLDTVTGGSRFETKEFENELRKQYGF